MTEQESQRIIVVMDERVSRPLVWPGLIVHHLPELVDRRADFVRSATSCLYGLLRFVPLP